MLEDWGSIVNDDNDWRFYPNSALRHSNHVVLSTDSSARSNDVYYILRFFDEEDL